MLGADDDDDALSVWADSLIDAGDPLGEVIAIRRALAALPEDAPPPRRRQLERRLADQLATNHSALYGPLAPYVQIAGARAHPAPALELEWGPVLPHTALFETTGSAPQLGGLYRTLCRLPLARSLFRMIVGRGDYTALFDALVAEPHTTLGSLDLRGQQTAVPATLELEEQRRRRRFYPYDDPDVGVPLDGGVFERLPALEYLNLNFPARTCSAIVAPRLRWLHARAFPRSSLAGSVLPALESLTLWKSSLPSLDHLPHLQRLDLNECQLDGDFVRRLAESPRLPQLQEWTAFRCAIGDDMAEDLIANAERFAHVKLWLTSSNISPSLRERLRARLPKVVI